ncbi:AraC family transcriptional regulator [Pseudobacteroides cellulosolvens]|uniref:Transcriptional regulator, AraC family n=1 Tax=Pseudobacteroides cellulosolvens ATCC 35603 = DSM 2933 TaxID=398512 RepID=A0A0L6JGX4_9FIRM|nr:helix-turn-helix domain-containing protein [Pseudobacteroides cellulosolvens]KNY24960.1 transcriptional regulator, AraC family [Pseudobacteroides cellulosolvens ATCC 35603 = DSM 2933]
MAQFNVCSNYMNSNIDLSLYNYGLEHCKPGYFGTQDIMDQFSIYFILDGTGSCNINNQNYSLEKGSGFLIPPDCLSYLKSSIETPLTYYWIGFDGINASYYLKRAYIDQQNPIFTFEKTEFVKSCFNEMLKTQSNDDNREIKLHSLLYLLLLFLIENAKIINTNKRSNNTRYSYINQATQFIYSNYSKKITVHDIAKYLSLDRKYLSKIFHEILNTTPKEFIIKYRIEKACELLTNPSNTISYISNAVGYNDPLQFSKIFKKSKGISPKKYKDAAALKL